MTDSKKTNNESLSINAHVGLGLNFDNFSIDLRWEKGLSKTNSTFRAEAPADIDLDFDTTANNFILGFTYNFKL